MTTTALVRVPRSDGGTTDVLILAAPDGTYAVRDRCLEGHTPDGTGVNDSGLTLQEALQSAAALALCLVENDRA